MIGITADVRNPIINKVARSELYFSRTKAAFSKMPMWIKHDKNMKIISTRG